MRLRKDIAEAGLPSEYGSLFYCPIGLEFGDNQPYEIAISIAGQLLQMRDQTAPGVPKSDDFGCEESAICDQSVSQKSRFRASGRDCWSETISM